MAQVERLWPTIIYRNSFPQHTQLKPALMSFIQDYMNAGKPRRDTVVNRNLFESDYHIFYEYGPKVPAVGALNQFLSQCFFEAAAAANGPNWHRMGLKPGDLAVGINASWFIWYDKAGFVAPHVHGNASWSCVYYLQTDETFSAQNGGTYFMTPVDKTPSDDLGALYMHEIERSFEPKEGDALIFPSHIVHGSWPYTGEKNRVIFSANARMVRLKEGGAVASTVVRD